MRARTLSFILLIAFNISTLAQMAPQSSPIDKKVDSVLQLMTLEEKIGQLNQFTGDGEVTGPVTLNNDYIQLIKEGKVGSMLNVNSAAYTRKIQKIAIEESRLGIPLIFGYDVIHGYETIFPVPLGESASWDLEAMERSARIAAIEATAAGQHWTFAPMVDIARDARWGRIMEGAGEDPYYGKQAAKARIRGFQAEDLSKSNTMLACAKHFAAYGAAVGGRDYNTVDISKRTLHELYLPPFKAAVDEGVATFMSSFNELNGIPVTGHKQLVRNILKEKWDFSGFIVSDWASVQEMIVHGYAKDKYEAGDLAMNAGIDMDMEGHVYVQELKKLVKDGVVREALVDEAVKRILRKKFELGLFEDPYRYSNTKREEKVMLSDEHRSAARKIARKSMVLLKNENETLPFSKDVKKVALIGPLGNDKDAILGTWRARGEAKHAISLLQGLKNKLPDAGINYVKGCGVEGTDRSGFDKAIKAAKNADIVIAAVGEEAMMSGEALSRMNIDLPGLQKELVLELAKLDKPMAVTLMNGRPLAIPEVDKHAPAILETWLAGTEAGNAIADVLFGDYNPSGKLTATFPYHVGQIPMHYNHKKTGRPYQPDTRYTSQYIDGPEKPLYPFGYGLSYTTFAYGDIDLSAEEITMDETLEVQVEVTNTGDKAGEEVVQLYVRDMVGSVTRPVKELKGFKKIALEPGTSQMVTFNISADDLKFYTKADKWAAEPGDFKVFVGSSSVDVKEKSFKITE